MSNAQRLGGQRALTAGTETIARSLQRAGYATACFGKWGLGGPGDATGHPLSQGFDRFYGFLCQRNAHNHYAAYIESDREKIVLDGNSRGVTGAQFVPDLCTNEAVQWIASKAPSDAPFFVYFATNLPHLALQAPEEAVAKYLLDEVAYEGKKGYLACPKPHATYAAMVTKIDEAVGRIVRAVTDAGDLEHTIFFFTSDNGAPWELGGFDPAFFGSNKGLRGSKNSLWEGGLRVPFIASWKGHVPFASACEEPVVGYDLFPTILSMTGTRSDAVVDGVSLYQLNEELLRSLKPDLILTQDLCDVCSIDLRTVERIANDMSPKPRVVSLNPASIWQMFDDALVIGEAANLQTQAERAMVELRGAYWSAVDYVNPYIPGRKDPGTFTIAWYWWSIRFV